MLTKGDLQQIAILLDEKLEEKLDKKLDEKFDEKLAPIKEQLQEHGKILEEHGRILKSYSRSLKSLKKNQGTMLNLLDREQMNQRKRLGRIENHLQLPSLA